jgi:hypothetical protein
MAEEKDGGYGTGDRHGRFWRGNAMFEKVLDSTEVDFLVL